MENDKRNNKNEIKGGKGYNLDGDGFGRNCRDGKGMMRKKED